MPHKLKIEAGLEKVRAVALKMKKPADMLEVCKAISLQLEKLGRQRDPECTDGNFL
jgi:hypothetical protein